MDADSMRNGVNGRAWRCRFDLLVLWAVWGGCGRPSRRKYAGTRVDFTAWLGRRPTASEQVAMSRSVARLVRRGLVLRLPGRRAVLTKAGLAAAAAGEEGSRPEPAMSLTPADPCARGKAGWASCPAALELSPTAQRGANGAQPRGEVGNRRSVRSL